MIGRDWRSEIGSDDEVGGTSVVREARGEWAIVGLSMCGIAGAHGLGTYLI